MGEEPPRQELTPEEAAFYRAVEDAFARLRGTPFIFSPKDFSLLQRWWREGVPLAAVVAGLSEVFARRREGREDPVSSLGFCRHAVQRHARRLAAAATGREETPAVEVAEALQRCVLALQVAARQWEHVPPLREGVLALARAVATLPVDAPAAAVDQALAQLELGALEGLAPLLPEESRRRVAAEVEGALAAFHGEREVGDRTRRALLLRHWRQELGLPRLGLLEADH